MEDSREYRLQQVAEYKEKIAPLLKYLPWLESKMNTSVSSSYQGEGQTEHTLAFPVYDGTLMNFVKEAAKNPVMDKNYRYVYSRNHLKGPEDERKLIEKATIAEWNNLCGILSYYVLAGRSKGILWNVAVKENIFYLTLKKMEEIILYWDNPENK